MKVKLHIQAIKYSFEDKFSVGVYIHGFKTDSSQVVVDIGEVEVEVDIPDVSQEELTLAHIEQLNGAKKLIQAECNAKIVSIDNQIANLLALTNGEEQ